MSTALVVLNNVPQMHLCSICPKPGVCCSNFVLPGITFWEDDTPEFIILRMKEEQGIDHFIPVQQGQLFGFDDKSLKHYGYWRFSCSKLKDGRCSIYNTRPAVCSDFVPTTGEGLCAFDEEHQEHLEYCEELGLVNEYQ